MDYNTSINLFEDLMETDGFLLTEDVCIYLESIGLMEDDSALLKLKRRLHMVGPKEKQIIQKAIDQLEKQEIIKKKKTKQNSSRYIKKLGKRYVLHLHFGSEEKLNQDSTGDVTPDTWHNRRNKEGVTFIYLPHTNRFLSTSSMIPHYRFIPELVQNNEITREDLPNKYKDVPENELTFLLNDSLKSGSFKVCITGRTGYGTERFENIEDQYYLEPCGAIWNLKVPDELLIKCFDSVNEENKMSGMIRNWFIPDKER